MFVVLSCELQLSLTPRWAPHMGQLRMTALHSWFAGEPQMMQPDTLSWQPVTLVDFATRLWRRWYLLHLTAQPTKSLAHRLSLTLSVQISSYSKWLLSTVLEWGNTQTNWKWENSKRIATYLVVSADVLAHKILTVISFIPQHCTALHALFHGVLCTKGTFVANLICTGNCHMLCMRLALLTNCKHKILCKSSLLAVPLNNSLLVCAQRTSFCKCPMFETLQVKVSWITLRASTYGSCVYDTSCVTFYVTWRNIVMLQYSNIACMRTAH